MCSKLSKISKSPRENTRTNWLDTLEITESLSINNEHKSLVNQSIRKYNTQSKILKLIDNSPKEAHAAYWDAYHCSNVKVVEDGVSRSKLCRRRYCQNCERIRAANMINSYLPALVEVGLDDWWFVTLTSPTVHEKNLKSQIKLHYDSWRKIMNGNFRKRKIKPVGIRALECTKSKGKYHPHFHVLIFGEENARMLVDFWLKQQLTSDIKGQHIQKVELKQNNKALQEIFKYAAKQAIKDDEDAHAMHVMYDALKGKRTIQSFGGLKKVKTDLVSTKEAKNIDPRLKGITDVYVWERSQVDYTNSRGDKLVGTKELIIQSKEQQQIKHGNTKFKERSQGVCQDRSNRTQDEKNYLSTIREGTLQDP